MAKRAILAVPNPALRAQAREVRPEDIRTDRIQRLIGEMRQTLAASADGIGLAAPQIGEGLRLFLVSEEANAIDAAPQAAGDLEQGQDEESELTIWNALVFINPVMTKQSRKKDEMIEGCLSVPGRYGAVKRPQKVFLEWYDEAGARHRRGFSKFLARVIQHELDHLDGILIADHAKKLFRLSEHKGHSPHGHASL